MNMPARAVAPGAVLALLLGLAGCAGGSSSPDAASASPSAPTQGVGAVGSDVTEADVEFAQMMIVHHRDALEMAALADGRTTNTAVLEIAAAIEATQGPEIDLMASWLQRWGAEVPTGSEMDPMEHGDTMPGAMSDAQMSGLADATGADFDTRFLSLMIDHHSGAVIMAEDVLEAGADPEVLALAQQIAVFQMQEIEDMRELLAS